MLSQIVLAGVHLSERELSCITLDHNAKSQGSTVIWDARHLANRNRTLHRKVFVSVKGIKST